jgi:hypothetical protein
VLANVLRANQRRISMTKSDSVAEHYRIRKAEMPLPVSTRGRGRGGFATICRSS